MRQELQIIQNVFSTDLDFERTALEVFQFQYNNNMVYKSYVDAIKVKPNSINEVKQIPFLPIRLFKTHNILTTVFAPEAVFESSGTTETINSKHFVNDLSIYERSFLTCFEKYYGSISDWCILGLLPSYLERQNSSLIYMVDRLIKETRHPQSGFYLNEFDELTNVLQDVENQNQKTLLIGVTFALLDFAHTCSMQLQSTIVMETGGMKGRKKELVKQEVHEVLKNTFGLDSVHSEYGMTELLSQAYSKGGGVFETAPWMKILLREEDDPLTIKTLDTQSSERGIINVIDLANIYSCSFIATDDIGVVYPDGTFEVLGRRDNSDLRGCSLLAI